MKTERINVRTTKQLKEKITKIAEEKGVPVSEFINDYIKGLLSSSGIN
jgi:antitoxin component of RelBE/YafQ-DinJ toxin-antitoxin module